MVHAWSRAIGRGGVSETALSLCLCKAPELGGSWDGATGWLTSAKGEEQNLRDLFIWHQALNIHASFVKAKAAIPIKSNDFMGGYLGEAWYRRKKLLRLFVSLILICWWPEAVLVLWTPLPPSFLLKQWSIEVPTKLDLLLPSLVITLGFTFMQCRLGSAIHPGQERDSAMFPLQPGQIPGRLDWCWEREKQPVCPETAVLLHLLPTILFLCWGQLLILDKVVLSPTYARLTLVDV